MHINDYEPGNEKGYVRDNVFLFFMNCTRVLTLPNLYFYLEKMLLKDGKQVECCEYKKEIFLQQKKIAPKEIVLHLCDVCELEISNYDALFLDFCGGWNSNTSKVLNQIKPGSRVVITFLMLRESKQTKRLIDLDNREESYINLLATFGISVKKYIKYRNKRSPMCVFFGTKF